MQHTEGIGAPGLSHPHENPKGTHMSYEEAKKLDDAYVMHTFGRSPVEFVGGHGMYLTDDKGNDYLDFLAGIAVNCLGYHHESLDRAVADQASRLLHVSNYFQIEHRGEVARMLSQVANAGAGEPAAASPDEPQLWRTFFGNSGAEANECAIKLARLHAKRGGNGGYDIVCLNKSFHGRTMETIAATMQGWAQDPFKPLPGGFVAIDANDVEALRAVFAERGSNICAVLLEPIQGESGVHPMTQEFMDEVRRLTSEHGALMMCDEVQCGMFRTGHALGFQAYGVVPDVFTLAKSLGGGVPMGACVARAEVSEAFRPGDHGSTFGGGPLACAAAECVLGELISGTAPEGEQGAGYLAHVREVGGYLAEQLGVLPNVSEVRGAGLMLGAELEAGLPDVHELVAKALEQGAVINATGPTTLRFLPPLVCTKADVDKLVAILADVLGE